MGNTLYLKNIQLNSKNHLDLPTIPKARYNFHNVFRFPGSFHPPLINYILKHNETANLIGDPLAGSGTVALEGICLGKTVYNMDIDPLSCLITSTLSNQVDPTQLNNTIDNWIEKSKPFPMPHQANIKSVIQYTDMLIEETNYQPPVNLFHWFDPYIVISICKLLLSLEELNLEIKIKNALMTLIASIIRRVSNADLAPVSGLEVTKIMRIKKSYGLRYNIFNEIKLKQKNIVNGYKELRSYDNVGRSHVFQGNILNENWSKYFSRNNIKLDLVITSPPYCNAIEYWRRHRLEYFWLGFMDNDEIRSLSRNFIGSTTVYKQELKKESDPLSKKAIKVINKINKKGKDKKALLIKKYFNDVEKSVIEIMKSTSQNGVVYIIVGPSTSYGINIDTPSLISEIITNLGYKVNDTKKYEITNRRMQYPTKNHSKIRSETILEIIHT